MKYDEAGAVDAGTGADANNGSYSDIRCSSERQNSGLSTEENERAPSDWENDDIPASSSIWAHQLRPQARGNSLRDSATSISLPPSGARNGSYNNRMSNDENINTNLNVRSSADGSIVAPSEYDTAVHRYAEITNPYPGISPPSTPALSYSSPYSQNNPYPISPVPSHHQPPPIEFQMPSEGTVHTTTLPPSASHGGASLPTTVLTPAPQGPAWTLFPPNGPLHVPQFEPASDGAVCGYFTCGLLLGTFGNIFACIAIFAIAYFMRDERAKKALISGTIIGIIFAVILIIVIVVVMVLIVKRKRPIPN